MKFLLHIFHVSKRIFPGEIMKHEYNYMYETRKEGLTDPPFWVGACGLSKRDTICEESHTLLSLPKFQRLKNKE